MKRFNRIISSIVLVCFLVNTAFSDYAFALSPQLFTTKSGGKREFCALGQKLYGAAGPGSLAIPFKDYEERLRDSVLKIPAFVTGEVPQVPEATVILKDDSTLPKGWSKNRILAGRMGWTDAMNCYLREEAVSGSDVEAEEVYYDLEQEGEFPTCRWEHDRRTGRWKLCAHTDFLAALEDIRNNDVLVRYKFPSGEVRTISLAYAIFFRVMKHEATDLRKRTGRPKGPGRGHFTKGETEPHRNELIADSVDGNYAFVDDAALLWLVASYMVEGYFSKYYTETLRKRCMWIFGLYDGPGAAEKNRRSVEELKLNLGFPNLLRNNAARDKAIDLALVYNKAFYDKYKPTKVTDADRQKRKRLIGEWEARRPFITRTIAATGAPAAARAEAGPAARDLPYPSSAKSVLAKIRKNLKRSIKLANEYRETKTFGTQLQRILDCVKALDKKLTGLAEIQVELQAMAGLLQTRFFSANATSAVINGRQLSVDIYMIVQDISVVFLSHPSFQAAVLPAAKPYRSDRQMVLDYVVRNTQGLEKLIPSDSSRTRVRELLVRWYQGVQNPRNIEEELSAIGLEKKDIDALFAGLTSGLPAAPTAPAAAAPATVAMGEGDREPASAINAVQAGASAGTAAKILSSRNIAPVTLPYPDARPLRRNLSPVFPYNSRQYSVQDRWIPKSQHASVQEIDEEQLLQLALTRPGWKVVVAENYDMMTYGALHVAVNLMHMANREFAKGLATGGTTESYRKALGLLGQSQKILGGLSIPADKVNKWSTLDNYYWPRSSQDIDVALSSYTQEQWYMLLNNLYGRVNYGYFVTPFDKTSLSLEYAAQDFRMRMNEFLDEAYRILIQLHGIGSDGHDAFNEIYAQLALLRRDYDSYLMDETRVQNIGHFLPDGFHPFFLRFMADNYIFSMDRLLAVLDILGYENIAMYYPEAEYRFKSEEEYVKARGYLIANYRLTPAQAITQGTGDILERTGNPDSLNLILASDYHKAVPLHDAVELDPSWRNTASGLQLYANSLLITDLDSATRGTKKLDLSKCFFFVPKGAGRMFCTAAQIESAWLATAEGRRIQHLLGIKHGKRAVSAESTGPAERQGLALEGGGSSATVAMGEGDREPASAINAVQAGASAGEAPAMESFGRLFDIYSKKSTALMDAEKRGGSFAYRVKDREDPEKTLILNDLRNDTMLALENLRMDSEAVKLSSMAEVRAGDIVLNLKLKIVGRYIGKDKGLDVWEVGGINYLTNMWFADKEAGNCVVLRPMNIAASVRARRDKLVKVIRNFDGKSPRPARKEALEELNNMIETGAIPRPVMTDDIFMHCHSTYSHSPGHTPEYIAWKAKLLGLKAIGLVDHETVTGTEEFLEAASIVKIPNTASGRETRDILKGTPFERMTTNFPGVKGETYMGFHCVARSTDTDREKRAIQAKIKRFTATAEFLNSLGILPEGINYDRDIEPLTEERPAGELRNPTEKHVAEAIARLICKHYGEFYKDGRYNAAAIECADKIIAKCAEAAGIKPDKIKKIDIEKDFKGKTDFFAFTDVIRKNVVIVIKTIKNDKFELLTKAEETPPIIELVREAYELGELPWALYLGGEKPCEAEDRTPLSRRQRLEYLAKWRSEGYGEYGGFDRDVMEWWLNFNGASMLHLYFRYLKVTCNVYGVMFMPNRNSPAEIDEVAAIARAAGFEHIGNGMDVNSEMPFTFFDYSNRSDYAAEAMALIDYERARRAMPDGSKEALFLAAKALKEGVGHIKVSVRKGDKMVYLDSKTGTMKIFSLSCTAEEAGEDASKHAACFSADPKMNVIVQFKSGTIGRFIDSGETLPAVTPDFIALLQQNGPLVLTDKQGAELKELLREKLRATPKQPKQDPAEPLVLTGHSAILTKTKGVFAAGTNAMEAFYRAKLVEDSARTVDAARKRGRTGAISEVLAARLLDSDFEARRQAEMAGVAYQPKKFDTVKLTYSEDEARRLRAALTAIGRQISAEGLVVGPGGNTSACFTGRDAEGREVKIMLIKASGKAFETMPPEAYIGVTVEDGRLRLVEGLFDPKDTPSTEVWSHRIGYLTRPDIRAVVHTHSPVSTGFATAGETFTLDGRQIGLTPYVHPGEGEMPEAVAKLIKDHDAVMITNHGVITVGRSLEEAYKMNLAIENEARRILAQSEKAPVAAPAVKPRVLADGILYASPFEGAPGVRTDVSVTDTGVVRIMSAAAREQLVFDIKDIDTLLAIARLENTLNIKRTVPQWAEGVLGMLIVAKKRNYNIAGVNITLAQDTLPGEDPDSVSADCVAIARALNGKYDLKLDDAALAVFAREGEASDFVHRPVFTIGDFRVTCSLLPQKGGGFSPSYGWMKERFIDYIKRLGSLNRMLDYTGEARFENTQFYKGGDEKDTEDRQIKLAIFAKRINDRTVSFDVTLMLGDVHQLIKIAEGTIARETAEPALVAPPAENPVPADMRGFFEDKRHVLLTAPGVKAPKSIKQWQLPTNKMIVVFERKDSDARVCASNLISALRKNGNTVLIKSTSDYLDFDFGYLREMRPDIIMAPEGDKHCAALIRNYADLTAVWHGDGVAALYYESLDIAPNTEAYNTYFHSETNIKDALTPQAAKNADAAEPNKKSLANISGELIGSFDSQSPKCSEMGGGFAERYRREFVAAKPAFVPTEPAASAATMAMGEGDNEAASAEMRKKIIGEITFISQLLHNFRRNYAQFAGTIGPLDHYERSEIPVPGLPFDEQEAVRLMKAAKEEAWRMDTEDYNELYKASARIFLESVNERLPADRRVRTNFSFMAIPPAYTLEGVPAYQWDTCIEHYLSSSAYRSRGAGDLDTAWDTYSILHALFPSNALVCYNMAVLANDRKDGRSCAYYSKEAHRLAPNSPVILYNEACLASLSGRPAREVVRLLRKAARIEETSEGARIVISTRIERDKDFDPVRGEKTFLNFMDSLRRAESGRREKARIRHERSKRRRARAEAARQGALETPQEGAAPASAINAEQLGASAGKPASAIDSGRPDASAGKPASAIDSGRPDASAGQETITGKAARVALGSRKPFAAVFGDKPERLTAYVYGRIEAKLEEVTGEFRSRFKKDAIENLDIGVIPEGDGTLIVSVDAETRTRIVGIYRSFIEGVARNLCKYIDEYNMAANRADMIGVLDALIECAVLHEIGHGFEVGSDIDIGTLIGEWEKATKALEAAKAKLTVEGAQALSAAKLKKLRENVGEAEAALKRIAGAYVDYAQITGYPLKSEDLQDEAKRRDFAEFIADLNIMGKGADGQASDNYIRRKAAYLFYAYAAANPAEFVDNPEALMAKVREYYGEKHSHLSSMLNFITVPAGSEAIDIMAAKVVEYYNAFFGPNTEWYRKFRSRTSVARDIKRAEKTIAAKRNGEAAAAAKAEADENAAIDGLLCQVIDRSKSSPEREELRKQLTRFGQRAVDLATAMRDSYSEGQRERLILNTTVRFLNTDLARIGARGAVARLEGGNPAPAGRGGSTGAPVAASTDAAIAPTDLATHPLVNAVIRSALEDWKPSNQVREFFGGRLPVTYDEWVNPGDAYSNKGYWLGADETCNEFAEIFEDLVKYHMFVKESRKLKKATVEDKIAYVKNLIGRYGLAHVVQKEAITADFIGEFEARLAAQAEHFSVTTGTFYAVKGLRRQRESVARHVRIERQFHINLRSSIIGADENPMGSAGYYEWRRNPEEKKLIPGFSAYRLSYNEFVDLAHRKANEAWPVYMAPEAFSSLGPDATSFRGKARDPRFEAPVASPAEVPAEEGASHAGFVRTVPVYGDGVTARTEGQYKAPFCLYRHGRAGHVDVRLSAISEKKYRVEFDTDELDKLLDGDPDIRREFEQVLSWHYRSGAGLRRSLNQINSDLKTNGFQYVMPSYLLINPAGPEVFMLLVRDKDGWIKEVALISPFKLAPDGVIGVVTNLTSEMMVEAGPNIRTWEPDAVDAWELRDRQPMLVMEFLHYKAGSYDQIRADHPIRALEVYDDIKDCVDMTDPLSPKITDKAKFKEKITKAVERAARSKDADFKRAIARLISRAVANSPVGDKGPLALTDEDRGYYDDLVIRLGFTFGLGWEIAAARIAAKAPAEAKPGPFTEALQGLKAAMQAHDNTKHLSVSVIEEADTARVIAVDAVRNVTFTMEFSIRSGESETRYLISLRDGIDAEPFTASLLRYEDIVPISMNMLKGRIRVLNMPPALAAGSAGPAKIRAPAPASAIDSGRPDASAGKPAAPAPKSPAEDIMANAPDLREMGRFVAVATYNHDRSEILIKSPESNDRWVMITIRVVKGWLFSSRQWYEVRYSYLTREHSIRLPITLSGIDLANAVLARERAKSYWTRWLKAAAGSAAPAETRAAPVQPRSDAAGATMAMGEGDKGKMSDPTTMMYGAHVMIPDSRVIGARGFSIMGVISAFGAEMLLLYALEIKPLYFAAITVLSTFTAWAVIAGIVHREARRMERLNDFALKVGCQQIIAGIARGLCDEIVTACSNGEIERADNLTAQLKVLGKDAAYEVRAAIKKLRDRRAFSAISLFLSVLRSYGVPEREIAELTPDAPIVIAQSEQTSRESLFGTLGMFAVTAALTLVTIESCAHLFYLVSGFGAAAILSGAHFASSMLTGSITQPDEGFSATIAEYKDWKTFRAELRHSVTHFRLNKLYSLIAHELTHAIGPKGRGREWFAYPAQFVWVNGMSALVFGYLLPPYIAVAAALSMMVEPFAYMLNAKREGLKGAPSAVPQPDMVSTVKGLDGKDFALIRSLCDAYRTGMGIMIFGEQYKELQKRVPALPERPERLTTAIEIAGGIALIEAERPKAAPAQPRSGAAGATMAMGEGDKGKTAPAAVWAGNGKHPVHGDYVGFGEYRIYVYNTAPDTLDTMLNSSKGPGGLPQTFSASIKAGVLSLEDSSTGRSIIVPSVTVYRLASAINYVTGLKDLDLIEVFGEHALRVYSKEGPGGSDLSEAEARAAAEATEPTELDIAAFYPAVNMFKEGRTEIYFSQQKEKTITQSMRNKIAAWNRLIRKNGGAENAISIEAYPTTNPENFMKILRRKDNDVKRIFIADETSAGVFEELLGNADGAEALKGNKVISADIMKGRDDVENSVYQAFLIKVALLLTRLTEDNKNSFVGGAIRAELDGRIDGGAKEIDAFINEFAKEESADAAASAVAARIRYFLGKIVKLNIEILGEKFKILKAFWSAA
jgi:L-fuculose-phosphate aldolase